MSSANITWAEAAERAEQVSVSSYAVNLDLTTGADRFASTTEVAFTAEPGTDTWIDLIAPRCGRPPSTVDPWTSPGSTATACP